MRKAWVISLRTIDAALHAKREDLENPRVLSLVSVRKREDYLKEHLRALWYFFRLDWYGLKSSFSLDRLNEEFDRRIRCKQNLVYLFEQPYFLKAERSDIIKLDVSDTGSYGLMWKPHDIIEGDFPNLRAVSGDVQSASILSLDMRIFFKK